MSYLPGNEEYYKHLNDYAKSIGLTLTIGNSGVDTIPSYVGTVDNIVIHDAPGLPSIESLEGWHTNYDKSNFSTISYGVDKLDDEFLKAASNHVGYIYVTDGNLPNPWNSLPAYFDELIELVSSKKLVIHESMN